MATAAIQRRTYAATYAEPNGLGEFGVDLIHQDTEAENGREVYREEVSWKPVKTGTWDLDKADAALADAGYTRVSGWCHEGDLADVEGWTADVELSA